MATSADDPSVVNATPPTTPPPLVLNETTGLASLSRSIAYTPFAAPPHAPVVVAYIVVFTAIGSENCALAGTNCAGFCRSLPDCRPTTCSMPSLEIAYATPDGRPSPPAFICAAGAPGTPPP